MRVLIMEDDRAFALQLVRGLETYGIEAEYIVSVPDALAALEERAFDAALVDIILRQDDGRVQREGGITLIHKLRNSQSARSSQARLPILAMSGSVRHQGMQDILTTAEQIGADAGIAKPFDIDELVTALRALCPLK